MKPIGSMVLLYMVTFTINIPQMLTYTSTMDPMGLGLGVFPVQDLAIINGWDLTCDKALRHVETGKQCLDETRLFSVFVGFKHTISMDWFKGKNAGPPLPYFMGKSMVYCRFSLKPIH